MSESPIILWICTPYTCRVLYKAFLENRLVLEPKRGNSLNQYDKVVIVVWRGDFTMRVQYAQRTTHQSTLLHPTLHR